SLNASNDNQPDTNRQNDSGNYHTPGIFPSKQSNGIGIVWIKEVIDRRGNSIDLGKSSDSKQTNHNPKDTEDFRQPFPVFPHSFFDIVEWSSERMTFLIDFT